MLERLDALEKAATLGPWESDDADNGKGGQLVYSDDHGIGEYETLALTVNPSDGVLIAAARNALPALLAVARAADELSDDVGVEMDDERLPYVLVQINRVDLATLREALAQLKEQAK